MIIKPAPRRPQPLEARTELDPCAHRLLAEALRRCEVVGACMRNRAVRRYSGGVLPLLVSLGAVQGCATNKSPLAPASTVDREFAAAAVTWDLNRDGNVTCDEWKQ